MKTLNYSYSPSLGGFAFLSFIKILIDGVDPLWNYTNSTVSKSIIETTSNIYEYISTHSCITDFWNSSAGP